MSLETPFGWGVLVGSQQRSFALLRQPFQRRKLARALWTLPLRDSDVVALGHRSQYIQDVLAHDADDPYWQRLDHSRRVANVTVPVSSIGGWYDIFLAGPDPRLPRAGRGWQARAAHDRAVDARGADEHAGARGHRLRACACARRPTEGACAGQALRHGRRSLARFRRLAAERLRTATVSSARERNTRGRICLPSRRRTATATIPRTPRPPSAECACHPTRAASTTRSSRRAPTF